MKKVQVIWTKEAIEDLEVIHDFLAINAAPAAQRICKSILGRAKQIENFPDSGSSYPGLNSSGNAYRQLVEGNYKIIYSHHANIGVVYIHSVFDARSNPERLGD